MAQENIGPSPEDKDPVAIDSPEAQESQKVSRSFSPINTNDRQAKTSFITDPGKLTRRQITLRRLVLSFGFIVFVIVAGTVLVNLFSEKNSGNASNQIRSTFSGEEFKDYTSPDNKFTILMPGLPTVTQGSVKSGDKEIPITTYERLIENRTKNYTVAVFGYSETPLDEPKMLENTLKNALENVPAAQIVSTQLGKYGELNSIEAVYNVAGEERVYEARIRYVAKDSIIYEVLLVGGDKAAFDYFADSLKFN